MKVSNTISTMFAFTMAIFALTGTAQGHSDRPDIDRDDGVVYVEGTSGSDWCHVYIDDHEVEIVVWYFDEDRNRWRKTDRDYSLRNVDGIVFKGFTGDDWFINDTDIPSEARGGPGNDTLIGGDGDDDLYGGPGRDTLMGEGGNDFLEAGESIEDENEIIGGEGMDIFVRPYNWRLVGSYFQRVTSDVTVEDFDATEDMEQWVYAFRHPFLP